MMDLKNYITKKIGKLVNWLQINQFHKFTSFNGDTFLMKKIFALRSTHYALRSTHYALRITHYTLRITLLLTAFIILITTSLSFSKNEYDILKLTENFIQIKLTIDDFSFYKEEIENEQFDKIKIDDFLFIHDPGKPCLPFITKIVGLPVNGTISAEIVNQKYKFIDNKYIQPNLTSITTEDSSFKYILKKDKLYQENKFYPNNILSAKEIGYVRDRYIGNVQIFPFQFNPQKRRIKVFTELTVNIHISGNTKSFSKADGTNLIDYLGDEIINNKYSKYWRKEREPANYNYTGKGENSIKRLKLIIDKEGIYKITYEYLSDSLSAWSGKINYPFDFNIDSVNPKYLELTNEGQVVPIYFYGENDGSFDTGDYFEFYADIYHGEECFYNPSGWKNCYFLEETDHYGARMSIEDGGVHELNPYNYYEVNSFEQELHLEYQNTYQRLGQFKSGREDHWFWKILDAPSLTPIKFNLYYPEETNLRGFTAKAVLFGVTYPDSLRPNHHCLIWINDEIIGQSTWNGQTSAIISNSTPISNQSLNNGDNTLYIDCPGDTPTGNLDRITLDYVNIKYWRLYIAHNNYLKFKKPSLPGLSPDRLIQFKLENFQSTDIDVYKINQSKFENVSIESTMPDGGPPYEVILQDVVFDTDTKFIALSNDKKLTPENIAPDIPSDLKNPNNKADYIIISKRDFIETEEVDEFIAHWKQYKNYDVVPVVLEDIYDEFNYGRNSTSAIRDFIAYAYNNWQAPALRYVLLLGDGIYDQRSNSYASKYNIVPTMMEWTFEVGMTISDNWFVCIVGDDDLPDLSIARIPVWEKEQIAPVFEKTMQYHTDKQFNDLWRRHILLTAGKGLFPRQQEDLKKEYIPYSYKTTRVYPEPTGVSSDFQHSPTDLKTYINSGVSFLQFIGHGGGNIWSDLNLLTLSGIGTLNNNHYPVVSSLTCYTSDFGNAGTTCLGEKFILEPEKGAIGFFGGAPKGFLYADKDLGAMLFNNLFKRGIRNFTDVMTLSKIEYYLFYYTLYLGDLDKAKTFMRGFNYLGDPGIEIDFPAKEEQILLNGYNFVVGDTLEIYLNLPDMDNFIIEITDENDITKKFYSHPLIHNSSEPVYKYTIPPDDNGADTFTRIVKFYAYNNENDCFGYTQFNVGDNIIVNLRTIPEAPTVDDSVDIKGIFFDKNGIDSVLCYWSNPDTLISADFYTKMISDSVNNYSLAQKIPAFSYGTTTKYHFKIIIDSTNVITTDEYSYVINAVDIEIMNVDLDYGNNSFLLKAKIRNKSDIPSPDSCNLIVEHHGVAFDSLWIPILQPLEIYYANFNLPLENGFNKYNVIANPEHSFGERSYSNNQKTKEITLNYFKIENDSTYTSSDNNLNIQFPSDFISQAKQQVYFYIEQSEHELSPLNQPDIYSVKLDNEPSATYYKISFFNDSLLADSLGHFKNGKKIILTFNYSKTNEEVQTAENSGEFKIYRWNQQYEKWILVGGQTDTNNDKVICDNIGQTGIYALFRNRDYTVPLIEVNVEKQEFTNGGFVDKDAVFSYLARDENGIDIIDHTIDLFLDGNKVPDQDLNFSITKGHLISIPVKYQLNVDTGNHTIILSASDVNGNYMEKVVNFTVKAEFDLVNVGNYPNPISLDTVEPENEGRTRFTYTLTDDADEVSINVYTVSGRLVKTFNNIPIEVGYHEYPRSREGWDCRDENGRLLANGVYFYRIKAKRGDKEVEKLMKMAILR